MRTYLLDTSAFSDLMREHPKVVAGLAAIDVEDQGVICPIVRGEVFIGLARLQPGRRKENLRQKAEELFRQISCEPLTEAVSDRYAKLKLEQQRLGRPLDENDLWIAATSLELDATLVTRDTDYNCVAGLSVVDWSK